MILDGFGYRESTDDNAIALAHTPHWDKLWQQYPHLLLSGSGTTVGLPEGQMGNSEVGHLNLGAGRVIFQEYTRIEHAIADRSFSQNPVLLKALQQAKRDNKAVHILGLLSPGGVHSHERQILSMLTMAVFVGCPAIYLHAFLDGRDTPPQSAATSLALLQTTYDQLGHGRIASIIGRYYAMDRDQRWERTQKAYDLLTLGKATRQATTAKEALALAYASGETDEFVQATAIHPANEPPITIQDGDVVIFMNYRADRARALTRAFVDTDFCGFVREKLVKPAHLITLTQYARDLQTEVAFAPESPQNVLGEYLSTLGMRQLRLAETEKYAHVTFFFNGGREAPFPHEERLLIPSPKVATYDLQPEMSAIPLTNALIEAILSQQYDVIICNYANPDMVGHTGILKAAITAIEVIDTCIGRVVEALAKVNGEMIITADHGNAECMFDQETKQPHTAHTHDPVPLVYYGRPAKAVINDGVLADVAPTILYLLALPLPQEMTGRPLFALTT
jgi:2,3-bisphosphoglycerate-independent phosphoglycerate mutase